MRKDRNKMDIQIQNLTMTYPNGKQALRGMTLELGAPSFVGLLGPNGAGKSTLLKLLSAALLPTSGSITIDGIPLSQAEHRLRSRLGYLPQDFGLFDELTAAQFLDYMAALKQLRDPKAAVKNALSAVNLERQARTRIRALSGGQRQRVGIAQALLGDPPLLILDEPTVGLDPEERIHFRNLFSQAAQDRLVLLSTHIIEDVQAVCDRLVVLDQGRILFSGSPAQLIRLAQGHVGVFWEQETAQDRNGIPGHGETKGPELHITARVNTSQGIRCRAVAEQLPPFAQEEEPSLEDAYLYLLSREVTG